MPSNFDHMQIYCHRGSNYMNMDRKMKMGTPKNRRYVTNEKWIAKWTDDKV